MTNADTDGDGINDTFDVYPLDLDTDGDGLPDVFITDWNCSQDKDGSLNWTVTTDPDYTGWSSHQKWQGEDFTPDGEWNSSSGETDATHHVRHGLHPLPPRM